VIEENVHRITVICLKWRSASRVLFDRSMLKGILYKMAILPAVPYGSECFGQLRNISRTQVSEMRTLKWMNVKMLKDRIRNEGAFKKLGTPF